MLAKKKRGKLGRKEKGNTDEVKKEYSGSDKRAWLRGRRPHTLSEQEDEEDRKTL